MKIIILCVSVAIVSLCRPGLAQDVIDIATNVTAAVDQEVVDQQGATAPILISNTYSNTPFQPTAVLPVPPPDEPAPQTLTNLAQYITAWPVFPVKEIKPTVDGAVADYGQSTVTFTADISDPTPVSIVGPDGKLIMARPTWIVLENRSTGENQLIATVTNSIGLISGSEVIYTNAFDSIDATIRYVYGDNFLEQFVTLQSDIAIPDEWLKDADQGNLSVQCWTEFIDAEPLGIQSSTAVIRTASADSPAVEADDTTTDFGGVGGLLAITYRDIQSTNFVAHDGNGNVSGLVNIMDGKISAQYEYGPFGEVIRATGPMAKANPIRFSTKYQDDETDLLYYGYRYYNSSTGRWISRDPIGESGGKNLYVFVKNDCAKRIDPFGLSEAACTKCGVKSAKLEVFGITLSEHTFHFNVSEKVVIRTDSPYDYSCCVIFKWQRSSGDVNGEPIPRTTGGSPVDGSWHLDLDSWLNDDIKYANRHPMEVSGFVPGVEITYNGYDAPGITGPAPVEPIPPGTTWHETAQLKLDIRDRCNNYKKVAVSNTLKLESNGNWPEIHYKYSK